MGSDGPAATRQLVVRRAVSYYCVKGRVERRRQRKVLKRGKKSAGCSRVVVMVAGVAVGRTEKLQADIGECGFMMYVRLASYRAGC